MVVRFQRSGDGAKLAGIVIAGVVVFTACGAPNEQPAGNPGGGTGGNAQDLSGTITGAGASTQKVAQDAWIAKFTTKHPQVSMSYNPIGSGGGRERFIAGATAYGGTDVALDESELPQARKRCGGELIEMPVYISPIAIAYNLPGVDHLRLTPQTLAKIFAGKITNWNAPALRKTNPQANLPNQKITPVHRSEESGTTGNFTDYLSEAAGAAWPYGASETWPGGLQGEAAQGTSGVVTIVRQTPGAITYADASQVADLGVAKVKVGDEFVGPSAEAAAKILTASKQTNDPGKYVFTYDLNRQTSASGTYPVVLVSYELACGQYDSAQTAAIVQAYLSYITGAKGQQLAARVAGSAPLPENLRTKLQPAIASISAGSPS